MDGWLVSLQKKALRIQPLTVVKAHHVSVSSAVMRTEICSANCAKHNIYSVPLVTTVVTE